MMKKIIFLIAFTVISFLTMAQFPAQTYSSGQAVLLFGQSNTLGFFQYGNLQGNLGALWTAVDTTCVIAAGEGGTYLDAVASVDWNASSTNELLDSLMLRSGGIYKNSSPFFWETEMNRTGLGFPGTGNFRRKISTVLDFRLAIWIQGENDTNFDSTANAYQANLIAMIAKVRDNYNKPDFRFVLVGLGGCYGSTEGGARVTRKNTINSAMSAVASADSNVEFIDISDLNCTYYDVDEVHYKPVTTSDGAAYQVRNRIITLLTSNGW